ncbi:MAG: invasin domain 3-containing protein, partial [Candidatus Neomarinimicrobiota bacterium]
VTNGAGLAVTTVTGVAGTIDQVAEAKAVLADYSSVRDSLDIDLRGVTMALNASPTRIPADGVSTAAITIDLHETTNGNPVVNRGIKLTTTRGAIAAADTTNSSGSATVSLTSGTASGTATVTATAGITNTVTVEFSALDFSISADDYNLVADGASSVDLTAILKDAYTGNPLNGRTIYWSTDLGTIPALSVTNASGAAVATLTAGTTAGTAKVYGRYGIVKVDSVSIAIAAIPDSSLILAWVNTSGNPNNGTETLTVTVIFSDENAHPVEGATINFTMSPTYLGSIAPTGDTNEYGVTTTTLTYSTAYAGVSIRIIATSQSGNISNYIDITLPEAN